MNIQRLGYSISEMFALWLLLCTQALAINSEGITGAAPAAPAMSAVPTSTVYNPWKGYKNPRIKKLMKHLDGEDESAAAAQPTMFVNDTSTPNITAQEHEGKSDVKPLNVTREELPLAASENGVAIIPIQQNAENASDPNSPASKQPKSEPLVTWIEHRQTPVGPDMSVPSVQPSKSALKSRRRRAQRRTRRLLTGYSLDEEVDSTVPSPGQPEAKDIKVDDVSGKHTKAAFDRILGFWKDRAGVSRDVTH